MHSVSQSTKRAGVSFSVEKLKLKTAKFASFKLLAQSRLFLLKLFFKRLIIPGKPLQTFLLPIFPALSGLLLNSQTFYSETSYDYESHPVISQYL